MSVQDNTFNYMAGQLRDSHPQLIASFEAESVNARAKLPARLDLSYGSDPRERFDLFLASDKPLGTILYFHAGYWQSRDKASFSFLANAFVARGVNFALANYPLCPNVTISQLLTSARKAVPALIGELRGKQDVSNGIVVAGHSAGGHISAELALSDWSKDLLGGRPIRGITAISGVFDLRPLVDTRLNDALRLTPDEARKCSPVLRPRRVDVPAVFAVGGDETPGFLSQNEGMFNAWREAGNVAECLVVPGQDHFSVLRTFTDASSALFERTIASAT